MVRDHAVVVDGAKRLAPTLDTNGKGADDLRKLAVTSKLGDAAVAGKDAAWFGTAFDLLVAQLPAADQQQQQQTDAAQDALTRALQGGGGAQSQTAADAADKAWAENNAYLQDAWKGASSQQGNA
jgi:hypothetical protein